MKLSDIGRYYKSTQGIYLSDSGGRRVVDKMADLSLNRAHAEWSGTDRPEFTDFDGISKVCVEAERENMLPYSEDFSQWNLLSLGGLSITGAAGTSPKGDMTATRLFGTTDSAADRIVASVLGAYSSGDNYYATIYVKNNGGDPDGLILRFRELGGEQAFSDNDVEIVVTNDWVRYEVARQIQESDRTELQLHVRSARSGANVDVLIWGAQLEAGLYPTNYIPTSGSTVTRLAPTAPIEDALPLTGAVAGVVDMVLDPDVNQYIFDGGNVTATNRSRLLITNGNLQAAIHGSAGGQIVTTFPFSITNYGRFVMKWAISWDYEAIRLFVQAGDEKYLFTNAHSVNDSSNRTVMIGSSREGSIHTSIYFKSLHRDSIVRTTEEEFEQLFEDLS